MGITGHAASLSTGVGPTPTWESNIKKIKAWSFPKSRDWANWASKLFSFSQHTMNHNVYVYVCFAYCCISQYTILFCPTKAVVSFSIVFFFFCYRRLRWHSFQISHRLSHSIASLHISNQSAAQLNLLQKFSLLRLTAIMEKYSMSNKHGWTWWVPSLIGKEISLGGNNFFQFYYFDRRFN